MDPQTTLIPETLQKHDGSQRSAGRSQKGNNQNNYFKQVISTKFAIFKACVCYFLSNFYFSPNDSPSTAMKNVFYFI